jgi:hypothetical protein
MKKGVLVISLLVISVLVLSSVGFASAGWFEDFLGKIMGNTITGNVVSGGECKILDVYGVKVPGYTYYELFIKTEGLSNSTKYKLSGTVSYDDSVLKIYSQDQDGIILKSTRTYNSQGIEFIKSKSISLTVNGQVVCPIVQALQENITCTDSDGGENYSVYGQIDWVLEGQPHSTFDTCVNSITVEERICGNGTGANVYYNCPNGCLDGACVGSGPDLTPPVISQPQPTGGINTTQILLGVSTNENATCGYAFSNRSISQMTSFATTGGIRHFEAVNLISSYYQVYVRCQDAAGNVNLDPFTFDFTAIGQSNATTCTLGTTRCSPVYNAVDECKEEAGVVQWVLRDYCTNNCSDGACVSFSNETTTCTDSDGGLDYYVKGVVTGELVPASGLREDTCLDNQLREMFCNKNGLGEPFLYTCPNGCSDGACITKNPECNPRYVCVVNPSICPPSGVQEKYCQDFECWEKSYTEEVKCNPGQCSGCELEGKCIPYGFRTTVELFNAEPGRYNLYCDIDGILKEQKIKNPLTGAWAECQNNYECDSNLCSRGQCIEILDITTEAGRYKSLVVKVICKLAHMFNLDNYNKCIYSYLGEVSNRTSTVSHSRA